MSSRSFNSAVWRAVALMGIGRAFQIGGSRVDRRWTVWRFRIPLRGSSPAVGDCLDAFPAGARWWRRPSARGGVSRSGSVAAIWKAMRPCTPAAPPCNLRGSLPPCRRRSVQFSPPHFLNLSPFHSEFSLVRGPSGRQRCCAAPWGRTGADGATDAVTVAEDFDCALREPHIHLALDVVEWDG